jgi:general secretion pathway protein E
MKLGEIIRKIKNIPEEEIEKAASSAAERGERIGEALLRMKLITKKELAHALAMQFGLPFEKEINPEDVPDELIEGLSIQFVKSSLILPLGRIDGGIKVAISDPLNLYPLNDLSLFYGGAPIIPVIASPDDIMEAINKVYDRKAKRAEVMVEEIEGGIEEIQEFDEPIDLLDEVDEAPIIKLVNNLLYQAVRSRASDVHFEPFEKEVVVRFRVDGVLHEIMRVPKKAHPSMVSRVKVMSSLNIAEKRLPQDGRARIKIAGKDIDLRVSVVPTSHGERVVMRLLDRSSMMLPLEEIGLRGPKLEKLLKIINMPHGIFLVTGPTGSGKTTTLYAAITKLNREEKNIITIEDPVEYQLKGIGQIQVNPKINLTFAQGLRAILRQDPDIIMVGEIRDLETAEIAIHASLTGHLVFSTLHTNDSAGAITRLIDMGVEPFLVASSLIGVLAQRLVRTICPFCKKPYKPSSDEIKELKGVNVLYRGEGCEQCMGTGYRGRTGIFELLIVDDDIRALISKNVPTNVIKKAAVEKGMDTLREDGLKKVREGITTLEEVIRVTQERIEEIE